MSSIMEVLDELGIDYARSGEHHHVRDGWLGVDCPWCPPPRGDKGRYRLGIEITSGRCNCWVSGKHSLASLLVEKAKISYKVADSLLKGVSLRRLLPKEKTRHKVSGTLIKPAGVKPMMQAHLKYLKDERHLDPLLIEKMWNVQGIGISYPLQWRLYIPIYLNGVEVSWTTRSIGKNNPQRYISAVPAQEKFHLKDVLYGIDMVRTTLVIVEGPTDAWNIGPGAAATLGLNYTPAQIDLMKRFPWRVVCFDNSPDAQKRADQLCDTLSLFPGRTTRICLDAEDPGSASKAEIQRLRRAVLE